MPRREKHDRPLTAAMRRVLSLKAKNPGLLPDALARRAKVGKRLVYYSLSHPDADAFMRRVRGEGAREVRQSARTLALANALASDDTDTLHRLREEAAENATKEPDPEEGAAAPQRRVRQLTLPERVATVMELERVPQEIRTEDDAERLAELLPGPEDPERRAFMALYARVAAEQCRNLAAEAQARLDAGTSADPELDRIVVRRFRRPEALPEAYA